MSEKLEWQALWDAMKAAPEAWIPTTENMWWQMLEVLPPRAQTRGAFLVGEASRHVDGVAVYTCLKHSGGEYFAKDLTVKQFKELTA